MLLGDLRGRLLRQTDPAGARDSFAYDANDRVTSWFTRRSQTIGYSYDSLSRLKTKTVPNDGTWTYGYHPHVRHAGHAGDADWGGIVGVLLPLAKRRAIFAMLVGYVAIFPFTLAVGILVTRESSVSPLAIAPITSLAGAYAGWLIWRDERSRGDRSRSPG